MLEPLKGRVLFVCAKPLHTRNGVVLVDVQATIPHALAPALPSGNKRVRIDGEILVLVALMVLLIYKQMDSHRG
jgi:hypothetical protein